MNSKIKSAAKPVVGIMVIVIGSAHTTLGVVGWVKSVRASGEVHSAEAFWFTIFGGVVILFGVTAVELERVRGYVPPSVLIGMAVIMAAGIAFMPVSGFLTLTVPIAFGVYRLVRRGRRGRLSMARGAASEH